MTFPPAKPAGGNLPIPCKSQDAAPARSCNLPFATRNGSLERGVVIEQGLLFLLRMTWILYTACQSVKVVARFLPQPHEILQNCPGLTAEAKAIGSTHQTWQADPVPAVSIQPPWGGFVC